MTTLLEQLLSGRSSIESTANLEDIGNSEQQLLLRDACHLAIGLGSWDLYDFIPFPAWFQKHLWPLLQSALNSDQFIAKVVKRRVAWIVGCWVSKIPSEMRPTIYSMLIALLEDSDIVVSLTAANSLRICILVFNLSSFLHKTVIDDCSFFVDQFFPFLDPSINRLFGLLNKVEESDSKLHVLRVLNILIQQMEDKVNMC